MFQRDEVKMMFVEVKESVMLGAMGQIETRVSKFRSRPLLYPVLIRPLDTLPKKDTLL